jgi:hypothetical protein
LYIFQGEGEMNLERLEWVAWCMTKIYDLTDDERKSLMLSEPDYVFMFTGQLMIKEWSRK